jgi:hypothetical protein
MELVSSALAAVIGLSGIVIGFRLQDRSTARRDQDARQIQQRAELRQAAVQFLSKLAAMRRLQNRRSVLRETGAPAAEQEAAKAAAMEARTAAGEALTELQMLTDDPHVLELAADVVDITFNLRPTGPTATGAQTSPGMHTTPSSPPPAPSYGPDPSGAVAPVVA